jgi:RNA polymerase sigma-70 factor (ECF subfamily)
MDLVQEAAVQAFRSLGTFQEGTNFRAWFMKVLTNKFYKSRAREARRGRTVPLEDAEDLFLYRESEKAGVLDTVDAVFDKLEEEEVQRAIDDLPEEFRIVCLLYFMNDFSYEEIAEAAGIPLGTVRSRLHRGRKLLQKSLWGVAESRGLVGAVAKRGQA